jgi:hypothetical protein
MRFWRWITGAAARERDEQIRATLASLVQLGMSSPRDVLGMPGSIPKTTKCPDGSLASRALAIYSRHPQISTVRIVERKGGVWMTTCFTRDYCDGSTS